jgi:hypothetical protein
VKSPPTSNLLAPEVKFTGPRTPLRIATRSCSRPLTPPMPSPSQRGSSRSQRRVSPAAQTGRLCEDWRGSAWRQGIRARPAGKYSASSVPRHRAGPPDLTLLRKERAPALRIHFPGNDFASIGRLEKTTSIAALRTFRLILVRHRVLSNLGLCNNKTRPEALDDRSANGISCHAPEKSTS